ncbi:MAG: hypothetical protein GX425_05375 [Peptococcaceae bacterium]|nr:hypothetical protein [Peptococcaceae bacterium]
MTVACLSGLSVFAGIWHMTYPGFRLPKKRSGCRKIGSLKENPVVLIVVEVYTIFSR